MTRERTALVACMLLGALGGISMAEASHDLRRAPVSNKSSLPKRERERRNKKNKTAQKARAKNRSR